jgi:ADP-heptose:LPS heptosyltransferase
VSKIITQNITRKKPVRLDRILNIQEFYEKRNKILITRNIGGLGDIFMHRMMFEDFKKLMPDAEIHFACPYQYHDALIDHPFIDKILDCGTVDKTEYIISYNTTSACGRYELRMAPFSGLHRSDIWAEHCGLKLNNHDMHIHLTDEEIKKGKDKLESCRNRQGPIALVCPISAMTNKNLLDWQLEHVVKDLYEKGCFVVGLHTTPILPLNKLEVPVISQVNLREWMSIIYNADYVVSVDTSAFHCAGGMGKPLVGIFTFADGAVYGRYYNFNLVQKHRSLDPLWVCGPCYNWGMCPKTKDIIKPCLTEISKDMLSQAIDNMFQNTNLK